MYNNYNLEVSKIFKGAEKLMMELNHSYVGTEHLLLSMLKNNEEIKDLLNRYCLTYDDFLDELQLLVKEETSKKSTCIYTPLLKRVIKNAFDISKCNTIKPIDLLVSLLEEGEGIAIRIMAGIGIDIDKLYDEIKIKSKKNNPKLEIYNIGKDLTEYTTDDLLIGREKEINLIIETLLRKNKNNPLLIGDAGVGKSAIVEELARRIKDGNVPNKLKNKKIVSIEMSSLVAGTKYRGEFEEKLNKVIKEVENNPEIIIYIDEIHNLVGNGSNDGKGDGANILKGPLARGKFRCLGSTTTREFKKYIEKDSALKRRFQTVTVDEPNKEETLEILKTLKGRYEEYHKVKYTDDILKLCVELSGRYIYDRHFPDKAIDCIDIAASATKLRKNVDTSSIDNLEKAIDNVVKEKIELVEKQDFDEAQKGGRK